MDICGAELTLDGWWWNRNEFRATFKEEHPDVKGVTAVGKAGGERWKSMSEAVRMRLQAPSDSNFI